MRTFLLAAALLLGTAVASQANRLVGVTLSGAPALTVRGGYSDVALTTTITVTNTSGSAKTLGLQRQIRSEVTGSENSFCFGVGCYPSSVTTSPTNAPLVLANNASDNSMVLDYLPNNRAGITIIRYAVYVQGSQDSTYVTVTYDASQRVLATAPSQAVASILSQPWPNPATAAQPAQLRYQLPADCRSAHLVLVSLADGRRVRDLLLPVTFAEGRVVLPLQGLAAGLYSCLLLSEAGRGSQVLAARRLLVE